MKTFLFVVFTAALAASSPVLANEPFGTKEEAKRLADALVEIIDAEGIEAAAKAIYDPKQPFVLSRMGVNLFQGPMVIADNQEPETVAADYSEVPDLSGVPVWPRISDAADREDDALLEWYHYDTQETYLFRCHSKRAKRDEGLVMVCR